MTATNADMIACANEILNKLQAELRIEVGSLDAHAWIEMPDGSIRDWAFHRYDIIKNIWNCNDRAYYYPNPTEYQVPFRKIIKRMVKAAKKYCPEEFPNAEAVFKDFYLCPKAGHCFMNAYAYKYFHPEVKLMIGSMGWEKKRTGTIYWEFGNANMDWKPKRVIEGYKANQYDIDWLPAGDDSPYNDEVDMEKLPTGFFDAHDLYQKRGKQIGSNYALFPKDDEEMECLKIFTNHLAKNKGTRIHVI